MDAKELRTKSVEDLSAELLSLRREHFNLRMQRATGQLARPHEYGRVKKDIARVKTIMVELEAAKNPPAAKKSSKSSKGK